MFRKLLSFLGLTRKTQESAPDQEILEDIRKAGVEDRLNKLMQTHLAGSSCAMGQLMILNLEAAKLRIGAKWPLVSRHVHMLVENILSQRLGRSNIYFRCDEGLYAIVFSDRNHEEAEEKCRALSIEIMNRLFGDHIGGVDTGETLGSGLIVHGQASDIKLSDVPVNAPILENIKALVIEQSHSAQKTVRVPSSFVSVLERSDEKLARLIPEARRTRSPGLLRRMKSLAHQLRELERGLMAMRQADSAREAPAASAQTGPGAGTGGIRTGEWTAIPPAQDPFLRLSEMIERAEAEIRALEITVRDASQAEHWHEAVRPLQKHTSAAGAADDIEWQILQEHEIRYVVDYLSLLDLETGVKGIHLARIRFLMNGRIIEPDALAREEETLEVRLIADRLVLREVANELRSQDGGHPLLLLPLDQATLDNISARRQYLQIASQFSEDHRRAVILELQLHAGWNPVKTAIWLSDLQPYCRAIFIRLPLDAIPTVVDMRQLGAWSVKQTSCIGIAMPYGTTFSVHTHAVLETLRRLGEALSMRCYVLGVNRARDAARCKERGIRYITYEAALPSMRKPEQIGRVDIEALLADAQRLEASQLQR